MSTKLVLFAFIVSCHKASSFSTRYNGRSVANAYTNSLTHRSNSVRIKAKCGRYLKTALAQTGGAETLQLSFPNKLVAFTSKNAFLVGMLVAVLSAKACPSVSYHHFTRFIDSAVHVDDHLMLETNVCV